MCPSNELEKNLEEKRKRKGAVKRQKKKILKWKGEKSRGDR